MLLGNKYTWHTGGLTEGGKGLGRACERSRSETLRDLRRDETRQDSPKPGNKDAKTTPTSPALGTWESGEKMLLNPHDKRTLFHFCCQVFFKEPQTTGKPHTPSIPFLHFHLVLPDATADGPIVPDQERVLLLEVLHAALLVLEPTSHTRGGVRSVRDRVKGRGVGAQSVNAANVGHFDLGRLAPACDEVGEGNELDDVAWKVEAGVQKLR